MIISPKHDLTSPFLTKCGSAMLIVIIVMTALTLFTFSVWRNVIFLHDIVIKKQEYERNFRAAEAALNMGLALCKKYPKHFFINPKEVEPTIIQPFTVIRHSWLGRKDQNATISIYPGKEHVLIRAALQKSGTSIFQLECIVEAAGMKKNKQLLKVKHWRFES
jgi:hypothetical protein